MGKLDSYKKANPAAFQTNANNGNNQERKPVFNLLVKVSGYEIGGDLSSNYVLGTRVDTEEEVKVRLQEIEQKGNYKRPEVAEFADKRNRKRYVEEGNFFVFEQSREDSPNTFTSRWGVPLDRDPRGTRAFVMMASLNHRVYERENNGEITKNEVFKIRTLINRPAAELNSVEDFEAQVTDLLTPRKPGSNPEAIVRITDDEGEKAIVTIYPERAEVENEYGEKFKRVVSEGGRSVEYFKLEQADKYAMIVAMIEDPEVKVEVIGASVLYPGTATREKLEGQHESSKKHLVTSFYVKEASAEPQPIQPGEEPPANPEGEEETPAQQNGFPEVGYQFCVIGTRTYDDGTPYLTYIKPLHEFSVAESIKDIQVFSLKK